MKLYRNSEWNSSEQLQGELAHLSCRIHDYEYSRGSQALLIAELRGREEVQTAPLSIKKKSWTIQTRWTEANFHEGSNADAITQEGKREDLEKKLRKSQSNLHQSVYQVGQFRPQIKEL